MSHVDRIGSPMLDFRISPSPILVYIHVCVISQHSIRGVHGSPIPRKLQPESSKFEFTIVAQHHVIFKSNLR